MGKNVPFIVRSPEGVCKHAFMAEIADTPELRRKGLSKRAELGRGQGMFFDKVGAYWMRGVEFPLDIAFIDKSGVVLEKQSMDHRDPDSLHTPSVPGVVHAVEVAAGSPVDVGDSIKVAKPLEKQAAPGGRAVADGVRKLFARLKQWGWAPKPLYGDDIARQAKKHGILFAAHGDTPGLVKSRVAAKKIIRRMKLMMPKNRLLQETVPLSRADIGERVYFRGVAPGIGVGPGRRVRTIGSLKRHPASWDKLEDYQLGKGFIPKTVDPLAIRTRPGESVQAAMKRELGGRYFLKPREAYDTAGRGLKTYTEADKLPDFETLRNYVAQPRLDVKGISPFERWVHKKLTPLYRKYVPKNQRQGEKLPFTGVDELRVHATGGKVIPGATSHRGSALRHISPFRTRKQVMAERLAQQYVDQLPKNMRNQSFGLDVVKLKNGKLQIIEGNMANPWGGASGFINGAKVQDAIDAGIKGRVPKWIQAQRVLKAAPVVGGGIYGGKKLLGDKD